MILKYLILILIIIFLFIAKDYFLFAIAFISLVPGIIGLLAAIILTVLLIIHSHYILAIILGLLIVFNLVGNQYIKTGSQKLASKMISYVDRAKITLYAILTERITNKYPKLNTEQCNVFAAKMVNEIFGSNEDTDEKVINEIIDFRDDKPELKKIITDSLRVFVQSNCILSGKDMTEFVYIFNNAISLGIFIEEGEIPSPADYLAEVEEFESLYNKTKLSE